MNALRVRQLLGGMLFVVIGTWFARSNIDSRAMKIWMTFLFCGMGGLGIGRGLGLVPQAPPKKHDMLK